VSPPEDSSGPGPSPPVAALVLAGALASLALLGPTRATLYPALLPWTIAFVALLAVVRHRAPWIGRPGILLGGAVLLRILFLLPETDLSDDLFRYAWDGWIRQHGHLPFAAPPDAPVFEPLRESPRGASLFQGMNSPAYISVYPPLSQVVFLWGGLLHEHFGWPAAARGIRASFTLLELGGIVALHRVLRNRPGGPAALALYAWNPLALVAIAGSGHSEGGLVLGIGLLVLGIAILAPASPASGAGASRGAALAWTGWTLAVLSKGIPLLLGPLLLRTLALRVGLRRALFLAFPAAFLATLLALPFLRPGDLTRVASSTRLYVELFEFNAGLFALVRHGWIHLPGTWPPAELASWLRGGAMAGAVWIGLRHRAETPAAFAAGAVLVLSLYLVTATTVHPWYLLWVLPFLALTPTGRAPWLWGAWASFLTYLVYRGVPATPISLLFWGGMLGILVNTRREWLLRPLRRRAGPRKARWILPGVEGSRVLDVGGAEGDVARALEEALLAGGRVHAAEGSHTEGAAGVVVADPHPGGPDGGRSGLQADGAALPLPDGSFDTVVLSFVLHHARDPDRVLAEALRVAARRVVVLESTFRGPVERRVLERVDRWVNAGRGAPGAGGAAGAAGAAGPAGAEPGAGDWRRDPEPLRYRTREGWIAAAEALGARVLVADRPAGSVHRVLRLVLEPGRTPRG
jgi:SAM-dependent methyltransferase